MNMVTNHDLNSLGRHGIRTARQTYGRIRGALYTLPGMPLIYTGQKQV